MWGFHLQTLGQSNYAGITAIHIGRQCVCSWAMVIDTEGQIRQQQNWVAEPREEKQLHRSADLLPRGRAQRSIKAGQAGPARRGGGTRPRCKRLLEHPCKEPKVSPSHFLKGSVLEQPGRRGQQGGEEESFRPRCERLQPQPRKNEPTQATGEQPRPRPAGPVKQESFRPLMQKAGVTTVQGTFVSVTPSWVDSQLMTSIDTALPYPKTSKCKP